MKGRQHAKQDWQYKVLKKERTDAPNLFSRNSKNKFKCYKLLWLDVQIAIYIEKNKNLCSKICTYA